MTLTVELIGHHCIGLMLEHLGESLFQRIGGHEFDLFPDLPHQAA